MAAADRAPKITMATLAEHLGVSRATISNAYNRPDQLSPALRDRIFATARELGYPGPDPSAQALRRGRTGAIGLVEFSLTYALADPASQLMLTGVAEACDAANVALVLVPQAPTHGEGDDDPAPDVVRTAAVDGFVAHCDALDDARRAIVRERGLPLVVLDGWPEPDGASVGVDDEAGAAALAEHVVGLGHRRVAIVAFEPRHWSGRPSAVSERRLAGYRRSLASAGIDVDDPRQVAVVQGGSYDHEVARAAADTLWARAERPTAVLAMSDVFARGTIDSARAAGLRVPEDVSVTGFDDAPFAADLDPPLTTVRQPHRDKGAAAVRALLDGAPPGTTRLPVEVVLRASTAPPP